jgi:metal-responsive CopG/Arc/MetJ family transcriptional regulator
VNVHVTFSIDPKLLERFDRWREANQFETRSAALVYLMRRELPEPAKEGEDVPY